MPNVLGILYSTVNGLNKFIDQKLPGCPSFQCKELAIRQEHLEFYCRDILECICSLFGDPQYVHDLTFVPEQHYMSYERKSCLYHEMYTCDWWWKVQVRYL